MSKTGLYIPLSLPRRLVNDMLYFARRAPSVPVQRTIDVAAVGRLRVQAPGRASWCALFLKAYARVAADTPVLRRAYLRLPWPHLREYPVSVASVAVE